MVKLPDGKKAEFRLYFVDTPESAFKSYAGGDTNHPRIREQAAYLGGITPEQAVETGKKAKAFALSLLASRPFDIHTGWDSPFSDNRFHAFVEVKQDGKPRWLHEILVEKGFARIHTKGGDLPDGTSSSKHKARLKELESAAKRTQAGAWGL
jgi:endonuclease YncB( thermonuclease family)